ncbi:hypothetical protein EYF80_031543 [Liparis tanakae]|uniref:Uncharacterized protein n=1 Tax=Liparis tanakae TaxID=230148 RepID=A0A4Z2GY71_9TELE|nr:hypothetical protein EYF80_031543 [Liparis tanakae]
MSDESLTSDRNDTETRTRAGRRLKQTLYATTCVNPNAKLRRRANHSKKTKGEIVKPEAYSL